MDTHPPEGHSPEPKPPPEPNGGDPARRPDSAGGGDSGADGDDPLKPRLTGALPGLVPGRLVEAVSETLLRQLRGHDRPYPLGCFYDIPTELRPGFIKALTKRLRDESGQRSERTEDAGQAPVRKAVEWLESGPGPGRWRQP